MLSFAFVHHMGYITGKGSGHGCTDLANAEARPHGVFPSRAVDPHAARKESRPRHGDGLPWNFGEGLYRTKYFGHFRISLSLVVATQTNLALIPTSTRDYLMLLILINHVSTASTSNLFRVLLSLTVLPTRAFGFRPAEQSIQLRFDFTHDLRGVW